MKLTVMLPTILQHSQSSLHNICVCGESQLLEYFDKLAVAPHNAFVMQRHVEKHHYA